MLFRSDGDLVAAADGVHRLDGTPLGLEAVNDVSTAGRPLAATDAGLYYLANGWMTAVEEPFRVIVRDTDDGTAHAAGERLYEREAERSEASDEPSGRTDHREGRHASREDGEWRPVELPVDERVTGVAYGAATYAVTAAGTFLADAGDGWRHRSLGLPDVTGVVVP